MKKKRTLTLGRYGWAFLFVLAGFELFSLFPPRHVPEEKRVVPYRQGIIHVHSIYSDGGGTPEEIAEAAGQAGMDFVILTDHNTSRARTDGKEKTYGKTDLFVEIEASTLAGHAVAFYSDTEAVKLSDPAVVALTWQRCLQKETPPGFFVAVAHPSNIKNPWIGLDRFPDGMEAVNFDSVWQREASDSPASFAELLLVDPLNNFLGALKFFEVYSRDFTAWDGMNAISPGHFAYLAHDTHAKIQLSKQHSLRWPDYLETFKLASNIVYYDEPLAQDFEARKKQLYQSIRKGRLAMTYHAIYPFPGNDWSVRCGEKEYRPGDEVASGGKACEAVVRTPAKLPYQRLIRLYRNGELFREMTTREASVSLPIKPEGTYRAEVWVKAHTPFHILLNRPTPYVFYNPIYLR